MTAAIRHPVLAFLFCVLATLFAAAGLPKLKFDDGLSAAFRSDYQAFVEFEEFQRLFAASGAEVAIHLSADDFSNPKKLRAAQDFVLEMGTLEFVDDRTSVFGLRDQPAKDGYGGPLFATGRSSDADIQRALAAAIAHPLNGGRLITPDLKNLLVAVRLSDDNQNAVTGALAELETLADEALSSAGVNYAFAGIPVLRARVIEDIIRDQTIMNGAGAVIGFVLCLIVFRGLLPAMNAGLPAVIALVWVLGFLGHSGIGINTLTNTLPVLIMVLAFADSMHLTYEKLRCESNGLDGNDAVGQALRLAGPPCLMTSLTTGLAFASLLLSGSNLIRSLAIAGMVAVAITFVAVILVNPLLGLGINRAFRNSGNARAGRQPLLFPERIWLSWLDVILRKPALLCFAGIAVLVSAAGLHSQITPRFSILENVNETAPELARHLEVERLFAPLSTIDVVVSDDQGGEALAAPVLGRLGEVHQVLADHFGDQRVVSAWNAARWLDEDKPELAGKRILAFIDAESSDTGNPFVSVDRRALRIAVLTPEVYSHEVQELADEIRTVVAGPSEAWQTKPEISGLLAMSASVSTLMINQLNYSFLAAAALSGLIIGLWCRRIWIGIVALVVNMLPILVAGAWSTVSGSGLQFASGLALTIAFGIAVDDTLHVLNRLRPRFLLGQSLTLEDVRTALIEITPVLVATTVVLVGGIGSAMLSSIPTIILFAQLVMAVLVIALLADIFLLPAILALWIRYGVRGR